MRNYGASPELLSKILAAPLASIASTLPELLKAMEAWELTSRTSAIAIYATIAVENPSWKPVMEYGDEQYFRYTYGSNLGPYINGKPKYCGRGLVQCTWEENYFAYAKVAKIPVGKLAHSKPDVLLQTDVSCDNLCWYFVTNRVYEAAAKKDWHKVRAIVNGGYNGLDIFLAAVSKLDKALAA
jgi:hypothetical protein